jgi:predicted transcriptional regulator
MSKVQEKSDALKLRKKGMSIKDIASQLGVSKGSVSVWCQNIALTRKQQSVLKQKQITAGHAGRVKGAQMNKQKRIDVIEKHIYIAKQELGTLSARDLLMVGIGLYWGEGVKSRGSGASLVNSDAAILQIGKRWFQECLHVSTDDFRPYVYISKTHADRASAIISFWSKTLNIPKNQFKGPFYTASHTKRVYQNRDTYNGVVALRVQKSTDLKYRIQGLISACLD